MQRKQMDALIEQHLNAEKASDTAGCVAIYTDDMYTDDIAHNVVGISQAGPLRGPEAARGLYQMLSQNIATYGMDVTTPGMAMTAASLSINGPPVCPASSPGSRGRGRRISFRMLHVFDFKDGCISRENVWLDGNAIVAQLTAPEEPTKPLL